MKVGTVQGSMWNKEVLPIAMEHEGEIWIINGINEEGIALLLLIGEKGFVEGYLTDVFIPGDRVQTYWHAEAVMDYVRERLWMLNSPLSRKITKASVPVDISAKIEVEVITVFIPFIDGNIPVSISAGQANAIIGSKH